MREVLDCGVLLAPGHDGAMRDWVAQHPVRQTRLRLHLASLNPLRYAGAAEAPQAHEPVQPDVQALARLAVAFRRYDACILPVAPFSLAWTRMALQQARAELTTPVLLLLSDMKAPAIEDLLNLGAADFITQPVCLESMRVRLGRMARGVPGRGAVRADLREPAASYRGPAAGYREPAAGYREPAAGYRDPAAGYREPAGRFHDSRPLPGEAGAQRSQAIRARMAPEFAEQTLTNMRTAHPRSAQESFRIAKAKVVDGFERDYIRLALSRHGGNVAQAARACSKHRRAFWALMRKHGIEAAPYRQAAQEAAAQP
ncbi:hypothetical protein LMG26858_01978 [Achromobacter anxifer]|uniref:DNA binding HTH domain-containing protein n=1 Tax=Achromobacter anxifer TaxID=1287737 RepID=A0A6S7CNV3_9BURK|nr:helix-turn-helix domain-containing protein [Achromobacter anxifer]CAB3856274.1 hypothetical protein LMG26858_01978 [Achromobacter anxifer]